METHNFEIQRLFRVKEDWAEKLGGLFMGHLVLGCWRRWFRWHLIFSVCLARVPQGPQSIPVNAALTVCVAHSSGLISCRCLTSHQTSQANRDVLGLLRIGTWVSTTKGSRNDQGRQSFQVGHLGDN